MFEMDEFLFKTQEEKNMKDKEYWFRMGYEHALDTVSVLYKSRKAFAWDIQNILVEAGKLRPKLEDVRKLPSENYD